MKKNTYEKPTMRVIELQYQHKLLAGSGDPTKDVPWWDGEGDSRRINDWEDEDNWEE